jgi:recombination protein RecR
MDQNQELQRYLSSLPGIGPRQARRIVYYLLRKEPSYSRRLGELLLTVRSNTKLCQETFHYFYSDDGQSLSPIASDQNRDHSKILVVETDSDLENVESLGQWQGTYFVLGGVLRPDLDQIKYESYIKLSDFKRLIQRKVSENKLTEVIFALSPTVNGDFTTEILEETLVNLLSESIHNIAISRLARGLSTGSSLEYIDGSTFSQALSHRDKK